jgi:hypothetical protein
LRFAGIKPLYPAWIVERLAKVTDTGRIIQANYFLRGWITKVDAQKLIRYDVI